MRGHIFGAFQRFDYHAPRRFFYYSFPVEGDLHASVTVRSNEDLNDRESKLVPVFAALAACSQLEVAQQLTSFLPREIGGSFRVIRESLAICQADIAQETGASKFVVSTWESGDHFPGRALLYRWCQALGLVCPPKTALVRVVDFSPELLRFLQEDPTRLLSLTPDEFEQFVANRLDRTSL